MRRWKEQFSLLTGISEPGSGNFSVIGCGLFLTLIQPGLLVACIFLEQIRLELISVAAACILTILIIWMRYLTGGLFLFLLLRPFVENRGRLFRNCVSAVVCCSAILVGGRGVAVVLGIVRVCLQRIPFSVPEFIGINSLLAALRLPTFLILRRADIFSAWYIGLLASAIKSIGELKRPWRIVCASADWLFVALVQEMIEEAFRTQK